MDNEEKKNLEGYTGTRFLDECEEPPQRDNSISFEYLNKFVENPPNSKSRARNTLDVNSTSRKNLIKSPINKKLIYNVKLSESKIQSMGEQEGSEISSKGSDSFWIENKHDNQEN